MLNARRLGRTPAKNPSSPVCAAAVINSIERVTYRTAIAPLPPGLMLILTVPASVGSTAYKELIPKHVYSSDEAFCTSTSLTVSKTPTGCPCTTPYDDSRSRHTRIPKLPLEQSRATRTRQVHGVFRPQKRQLFPIDAGDDGVKLASLAKIATQTTAARSCANLVCRNSGGES
jgi:hypothetical protein